MSNDPMEYAGPTSVGGLAKTMASMPTDGEWFVDETKALGAYGVYAYRGDHHPVPVCFAEPAKANPPRAERDANMRIMAASKDLLAAVAAMLRTKSPADIDAAYALMRAAYTKATNPTPLQDSP